MAHGQPQPFCHLGRVGSKVEVVVNRVQQLSGLTSHRQVSQLDVLQGAWLQVILMKMQVFELQKQLENRQRRFLVFSFSVRK